MRTAMILTVLTLLLAAAPAGADPGTAGAEPFAFLSLDADARPAALGGAYTAMAKDANALLYNPGGLGRIDQNEATFMHNEYLQSMQQDYAALATRSGFGFNFNRVGFGSIPRTTLSHPDGSGTTSLADMAFAAGYGFRPIPAVSVGAGAKYVTEQIDARTISAFAVDAGAIVSVPYVHGLDLGASFLNLGPATSGSRENLPTTVRVGAAYAFSVGAIPSTLTADVRKERTQDLIGGVALETLVLDPIALRAGFNGGNDAGSGLTVGFGYRFRGFSVDYAFAAMGQAGDAQRISVTWRWGAGEKPVAGAPAAAAPAPQPAPAAPTN